MEGGYLSTPLLFLIQIGFGFYTMLLLLRFLLQATRADFYNPISQMIVNFTAPVLRQFRRFIPGYRGLDIASLVAAWVVTTIESVLILAIVGFQGSLLSALPWALPQLVSLLFTIFIFSIVIQAIMSWFPATHGHPLQQLVSQIAATVTNPVRRLFPVGTSGIDFTPMLAIIGLIVLKMLILPPLFALFGIPPILQR
ncbi:YggT family protein [Solemya velum gill symbiont]|uniref:YGGT family protein n=1 Tax=Solemya velum gill symbiont TaxID=2340 RepID=A0A0B0H8V9_SOVGS|nr:YggT family protein [Solemya velum gill symbiont]KHF25535.1 YGGT family protein [Solemya velum gill symbiont]OOY35367.1 hypothetical protein BOV88_05380 [Solemya velum gill symbiont]OOY38042.1 hypothetical protein BOV89_04170 [Solemya velum gill symbiont]OOY39384.1 hypothetical protein BOV90_09635 [Solemya velum gill symbiont]OOY46605.1 hypothetical protein BOV92_02925 [Solemya velum gill symbiont]